jgi:hypothetical protein
MREDEMAEWFEQKTYGYGAGLPIAPEGWAVIGGYAAGLLGLAAITLPARPAAFLAGKAALTVGFVLLVARTTKGGFEWRWGDER